MKQLKIIFERGDSVKFGNKWCKAHNSEHLIGKTIMMTPQYFEYDNGLYVEDQECPGMLEEGSEDPDSIYHLFGNEFENFMDCELVKGTDEDKATYRKIIDDKIAEEDRYWSQMAADTFETA